MEVPSRPVPAARGLTARLAVLANARVFAALAFGATLVVALVVVLAQPIRSPWWTYADADATYSASALNLLLGAHIEYLDHPGLPLEELGAVAFGVQFAVEKAIGHTSSRQEFVDEKILHLDQARPVFRGLAVAIYLAGALLSFLLIGRLLGHWTWGLAAGLLWIAAPGLAAMSIQFRPDVALTVLSLVFAYLVGRAVVTRAAAYHGAAALVVGLATMVKMHAAGLLVPLAIAAVWRHPDAEWWPRLVSHTRTVANRKRRWIAAVALPWVLVAAAINWTRLPFEITNAMAVAAVGPPLLLGGYLLLARRAAQSRSALARRLLDPFYGFLGSMVLAGLLIPVTIDVPEGLQSLVNVFNGLSGRGINDSIEPFSASLDQLLDFPLRQALAVFLLAGVAAAVGLARRDPLPVVWFSGALVLGLMAEARLAAVHYFAPAFVLSVPAALWLLGRGRGRAASLLVWPIIAYAVVPQLQHRDGPRHDTEAFAAQVAPSFEFIERRLEQGEVGLAPSYWPHADVRYFGLVQFFVRYSPPYPYRFVEATGIAVDLAKERGFRFRYYTGPDVAGLSGTETRMLGGLGPFTVRPVSGAPDVVELLDGPGVAAS